MTCDEILAAVLRDFEGRWHCSSLSSNEHLIVLPLTFADGDNVEVLVRVSPDGIATVSDAGLSVGRLASVDVNPASSRVRASLADIALGYSVRFTFDDELQVDVPVEDT